MRIGVLAKRTGTSVPTIRYYEQVGLLRPAARSGGQRIYGDEDVRRLAFIRRCRDFDYSIDEVRSLLSLMHGERPCTDARDLAAGHLAGVRRKLAELKALEIAIATLVTECGASCAGGPASGCVIFQPV